MSLWAILPVQDLDRGKSRLAPILDQKTRRALNLFFLHHSLAILSRKIPQDRIVVVSPSEEVLSLSPTQTLLQQTPGLNAALTEALSFAQTHNATSLLILSTDLPLLNEQDVETLLTTKTSAIAPDRSGKGTNALLLNPVQDFPFTYGEDSCTRHLQSAAARGIPLTKIQSPGLESDLDTYEDWMRLQPFLPPEFSN